MPEFLNHIDVLCAGAATYDLFYTVDHHPDADEKLNAVSLLRSGGGPAGNAAVAIARLGKKAAFLGYLGNDPPGDLYLDELVQAGIDTGFIRRGTMPTPTAVILVKPDGQRSVVQHGSANVILPGDAIHLDSLSVGALLFDGHQPQVSQTLLQWAKQYSVKTILDAGSLHAGTNALMNRVDYLVASEIFARQVTGEDRPEKALQQLKQYAPFVVITLGERGLIWSAPHSAGRLPAYPVNTVDTTGAGDVFHGAFAACIATGTEFREALTYASAAAAMCCQYVGVRPGLPTHEKVIQFMESQGTPQSG